MKPCLSCARAVSRLRRGNCAGCYTGFRTALAAIARLTAGEEAL